MYHVDTELDGDLTLNELIDMEFEEDFDPEQPDWIEDPEEMSIYDIDAIMTGGCASGSYMPAVTYHTALETMADHGDDVLSYIHDQMGELPKPSDSESWSGMASHYLSLAVELWASSVAAQISALEPVEDEDEDE